VIGGYDIINNDADPMDDHGHGTHVAELSLQIVIVSKELLRMPNLCIQGAR